jgi:hypothetical protein
MEWSFSASAQPGPDAMAISAARFYGTGQRSIRAQGTPLSSQGSQIQQSFFAFGNAGTSAAVKVKASG